MKNEDVKIDKREGSANKLQGSQNPTTQYSLEFCKAMLDAKEEFVDFES